MRASTLAGGAIVVVAGLVLALIALRDAASVRPTAGPGSRPAPVSASPAATDTTAGTVLVRASATTNVYVLPDRTSELVAVLPAEQRAAVDGRSADGAWLHITYPPGSAMRGWARAAALLPDRGSLDALPVVAASIEAAPSAARPATKALPDPAIVDVFLIQGEKLAVGIRNLGSAPLTDATMTLRVTKAEGELVGVLRIGPTTLAPGASATVVTPLTIKEPGSYRIELDPANEIAEVQKSNNTQQALLIPSRG